MPDLDVRQFRIDGGADVAGECPRRGRPHEQRFAGPPAQRELHAAERHDFLAEHKAALDVAFSLEQNQYNGETYVELTLADLKSPDPQIQRSPDS